MPGGRLAARFAMLMPERALLEALAIGLSRQGLAPTGGAFTSAAALIEAVPARAIDVVLIPALDEAESALAVARQLTRREPGVKVAVLVVEVDEAIAQAARERVIDGVLLCASPLAEIAESIRRIAAGEHVVTLPSPDEPKTLSGALERRSGPPASLLKLSPRQRDVLELLADGHSNDEMADQLHVSVNTVKYHVRGLYRRLGVHTRVQATRALVERRERSSR